MSWAAKGRDTTTPARSLQGGPTNLAFRSRIARKRLCFHPELRKLRDEGRRGEAERFQVREEPQAQLVEQRASAPHAHNHER